MKTDPVEIFDVKPTAKEQRREGKLELVGDEFVPLEQEVGGYEDEWTAGRLHGREEIKGYGGVHWLNKAMHLEPNYTEAFVCPWRA
jgi:hypothetical protein